MVLGGGVSTCCLWVSYGCDRFHMVVVGFIWCWGFHMVHVVGEFHDSQCW